MATTGTLTHGHCITCGKQYPIGRLQAGHFLPGRTDTILFDEGAVHAQCYKCNVIHTGMWPAYYRVMQDRHGQDWIEDRIEVWERDEKELSIPKLSALTSLYTMQYEALKKKG